MLLLVQFGMGLLHQLGLMDLIDLLELSKGLSKIGAKILSVSGSDFGHQSPPSLSSIKVNLPTPARGNANGIVRNKGWPDGAEAPSAGQDAIFHLLFSTFIS